MYIKKILTIFMVAIFLLLPVFVFAQNDYGAGVAAEKAGLKNTKISKMGDPATVVGEIINIALSFIGIIFFGLILYAGFTWMTAMGNTEQVTKAKNIIEAAVIGLVLVAGAYAIANFVFQRLGSGGGGESSGSPTAQTCSQTKGADWSCKNIGSCGLNFAADADTSTKRTACSSAGDKCALDLCPGSELIVCCK